MLPVARSRIDMPVARMRWRVMPRASSSWTWLSSSASHHRPLRRDFFVRRPDPFVRCLLLDDGRRFFATFNDLVAVRLLIGRLFGRGAEVA